MVRTGERPPPTRPPHGHSNHNDNDQSHTMKRLIIAMEDLEFAVNRLERGLSRLHGVLGVKEVKLTK